MEHREEGISGVVNPVPLGLIALALSTALLGASFARFLMPRDLIGVGTVATPVLIYAGVVQVLAGMWAFRRNNLMAATLFSIYGGFLVALGVLFLPTWGLVTLLSLDPVAFHHAVGLLFFCWLISIGVLLLGALKTNMALVGLLGCLALAYLLLAVGEFANANSVLLIIGGCLAMISALIAWYIALGEILQATHSPFQLPMGERGVAPVTPSRRYSEPAM
jgi:succinate-acetate transporter protein